MRRPSLRDDRGSATVVAVAMVGVLLSVTAAGSYLAAVVVARHRAQAAADLSALAAASRLPNGADSACATGVLVARQMRAGEARCTVEGLDVVITVRTGTAFGAVAQAAARAGPTDSYPKRR